MLGFVEGKIISKSIETSQVVVLCSGVGYEVTLSKQNLEMTQVNSNLSLWLYTHVREDAFTFFGFYSEDAVSAFQSLKFTHGTMTPRFETLRFPSTDFSLQRPMPAICGGNRPLPRQPAQQLCDQAFSGTVIKHKIRPECQHSVNPPFFATLRPLLLHFGISDCDDD